MMKKPTKKTRPHRTFTEWSDRDERSPPDGATDLKKNTSYRISCTRRNAHPRVRRRRTHLKMQGPRTHHEKCLRPFRWSNPRRSSIRAMMIRSWATTRICRKTKAVEMCGGLPWRYLTRDPTEPRKSARSGSPDDRNFRTRCARKMCCRRFSMPRSRWG